jgi:hypothetical protein
MSRAKLGLLSKCIHSYFAYLVTFDTHLLQLGLHIYYYCKATAANYYTVDFFKFSTGLRIFVIKFAIFKYFILWIVLWVLTPHNFVDVY